MVSDSGLVLLPGVLQVVLNDIKKVQKLIASEKTKAAPAQAKPPGKKDTSASVPQHPIFEEAGNMSEKFEPVAESDWKGLQLDMPAIIDIEQDTLGKLFGLEAKLALGQLKKMFKAGIAPRAEVALDLVIVRNIASTLEPKIPQDMMFYNGKADAVATASKELSEQLHKAMLTTGYAISPGHTTFAMEKMFLPCLRFASEGIRQIVLLPYEKLVNHLSPEAKDIFDGQVKQSATQFLKFCSRDKLKA